MMSRINPILSVFAAMAVASSAMASPVQVTSQDLTNQCDVMAPLPNIVDELGTTAVFPLDERISAVATFVNNDVCTTSSSPAIPNVLLSITNLTTISFTDLHYVSDPGTGFTNFDGVINAFEAVRLDNIGVNRPLVAEIGGVQPLVFEPGETWQVVLDDWGNGVGLGAADLGSIGVPTGVVGDLSSGSIVAIPIPEPGSMVLAAGSLLMVLSMRKTKSIG